MPLKGFSLNEALWSATVVSSVATVCATFARIMRLWFGTRKHKATG